MRIKEEFAHLLQKQGLSLSIEPCGTILVGDDKIFSTSPMYSFENLEQAYQAVSSGQVKDKINRFEKRQKKWLNYFQRKSNSKTNSLQQTEQLLSDLKLKI